MEQQETANTSTTGTDHTACKPARKKDNTQPFLFDYIPIVDATALANLFDQLRVETK